MKKWRDNFIYYRENRDRTIDYIDLSKIHILRESIHTRYVAPLFLSPFLWGITY